MLANDAFAEYAVLRGHTELRMFLLGPSTHLATIHVGLPSFLCHGDLHHKNILFYKEEDGTASDRIAAFIDWTSVVYGKRFLPSVRPLPCLVLD